MNFADKGDVADIDPAFFVGYLYRLKATGTLKFDDPPIQRAIYFRDGRVLFSSSNAPEDQLGAILVAAGKIEQDQFDLIVATLQPKQSIAAALAQGGHVSQKDIGEAARRKVEQIIGSCCAQTTGRYEFENGVLPKGALDLKLTTEKVLVSSFDALEPSGFLIRILKSPMAVLAQGEATPVEPELVRLREALDGVSSLADIGGAVGLPLAATEARAAVLVVTGAASVVTSQIEEMSLPDTGETVPGLSLSDDSETVEAETIGFAPGLSGAADNPDSTLVMSESEEGGFGGGGDETLTLEEGAGIPPPPSSGLASAIAPEKTRRERATTQDLDAVKELIGTPGGPPSRPGSASIPSQRWEPMLSAQGRPNKARGGLSEVFQNPMVKTAAAVILIAAVGVVGWFAYSGNQSPAGQTQPAPLPSPTATPRVADAAPGDGSLLPVPPVAATASPSGPAPAVTTPTLKPTPAPQRPTPAPAPPTPVAATTPAPAPPSAGAAGAYEALKAGRLSEAAGAFVAVARTHRSEFSVQVLVACSAQTIEKALQNDSSPELFVLPATINGKACHRLMRGYFRTSAAAAAAVPSFPPYYAAEGAKPRAVAVKDVLP